MTDRELLEAAAKAAGYWSDGCWNGQPHRAWDPLADDGDALRLAVKLNLSIDFKREAVFVSSGAGLSFDTLDPTVATRRAIVRAAAEIGRSKT